MCTCRILEKNGVSPIWYTIECTNNAGQKKYYAFAMANDASAIQYAENVLCQDNEAEGLITAEMQNDFIDLQAINEEELLDPPINMSSAFLQANPTVSVSPQITITQPQIQVYHSTNCGSSIISATSLSGPGGNYLLQNGTWNVTPGVYIHRIGGKINGSSLCEIRSQLYYN